ncbi:MAG TPA: hypothetical protein VN493_10965 [Thermoanaerobaculia bacterium]|nr:hypothetical protein [Thermoanaerobaculia bacterium]
MLTTPPPSEEGAGREASTVSRERERLYVTPRGMVPVPGTKSVFGRGFFRRFHASKVAYVLLVFLAAGTALFLFGLAGTVGPDKEALREEADPAFFWGAMAFGGTLILFSLLMIQMAIIQEGDPDRPQRVGRSSEAEPWTWDHPWSKRWMKPDYGTDGSSVVLGRVVFFSIVALLNIAWLSGSWIFRGILILLDLFALLIVYDTLYKTYQVVRFRGPVVIWEEIPVFLGQALRGRIAFPRDVRATAPLRLTLRCVRDELVTHTTPTGPQHRIEPYAIYRETREIPLPGEPGSPLEHVDFSFDVPNDLPGTELNKVYWQVVADVPLPGPDLDAVFLAPVYQRSKDKK